MGIDRSLSDRGRCSNQDKSKLFVCSFAMYLLFYFMKVDWYVVFFCFNLILPSL